MARNTGKQDHLTDQEIDAALRAGAETLHSPNFLVAARYDRASDTLFLKLASGQLVGIEVGTIEALRNAPRAEIPNFESTVLGDGLRWPALDVDLNVPNLIGGILGSKAWMSTLGRKGGTATSDAKATAARRNGSKGGRPRTAPPISTLIPAMPPDRSSVLRFTGQPQSTVIDFTMSYPVGNLNNNLAETMEAALKALALALGRERTTQPHDVPIEEIAVREALIGFGILAFNEGRAFLIVAGAGLDRHARIHFRSIMEYELRVRRFLEDPKRATAFLNAFAHELRKAALELEIEDEAKIESEIEAALGKSIPSEILSEKRAIYGKSGDVKSAMARLPDGRRRYAGTFSWPSQVSHGSILALRDVAKAINGIGRQFLDVAGRDGYANHLGYILIWTLLYLANAITMRFENGVLKAVDAVIARAVAVNELLQFVTPEQEQRALQLRAQAERRLPGLHR